MAQKRMIDKKISLSEKVADLDILGKLLYTWMIPHADDLGLLQGSPRTIKGLVMPMENATVEDIGFQLENMKKVDLIRELEHNGKKYYYIVDFEKNQTLKQDRQPQTILDFEHDKDAKTSWANLKLLFWELSGIQLEDIGIQMDTEVKGREGKIREEREKDSPSPKLIASINYLKDLPPEDLEEFHKQFECSKKAIKDKAASLIDYCKSHGKKYKDYKAVLNNALRKDFGTRKQEHVFVSPVDENFVPASPEKVAEARKKRDELAGKLSIN
jgi:DnaJ-domain-containing protein 1